MIRTTRRVMTILLILCLVATLLPTAALAAGELVNAAGSIKAGVSNPTVTLQVTGGEFNDSADSGNFTLAGDSSGLTVGSVSATADQATVNLTGAATKQGTLQINVAGAAFNPEGDGATASVTIEPADEPSVSVNSGSSLTAGTPGGIIILDISEGNSFASTLEAGWFTLTSDTNDSLTVTGTPTGGGTTQATLTVAGTPTRTGFVTVKINQEAFQYQPASEVEASGNATIKAPTVSAEVSGGPLTVGQQGTFTVEATGSAFAADLSTASYFTLSGGVTGAPTSVAADGNTATLTVTPTTATPITVTSIDKAAFQYQPDGPVTGGSITGSVTVYAAAPTVTASGNLTAGEEGQITLTITGGDNTFVGSAQSDWFTLTGGASGHPSAVTDSGKSVKLTVKPTSTQPITIEIDPNAFTSKPQNKVTARGDVTPSSPTVTASATGTLTQGVAGGQITVRITSSNDTFKSGLSNADAGLFTVKVDGESLTATEVTGGGGTTATLTMPAPTKKGDISVVIDKNAFNIPASGNVTADSSAKVDAPTGTVTAALEGGQLYAGTPVGNVKIKLTAQPNLTFADSVNKSNFSLVETNEITGLTIDKAEGSGSTVTLTLSGTPSTSGSFKVEAKPEAFKYPPTEAVKSDAITVSEAPAITLEGTAITAGVTDKVTVKITGGDVGSFDANKGKNNFSVSGIEGVTGVTDVQFTESNKTAVITLNAVPTTSGTLTVTVQKEGFTPVAKDKATANITVSAPTGDVTASLESGTLTAGTAAGTTKIKLSVDGTTLNFNNDPAKENFTLENDTGNFGTLEISDVTGSGKTVTLSLTGIPLKQGTIKVKVKQGAFVASPGEDKTTTNTVNIDYPTVSVSPNPQKLLEDDETVKTITLTVTGSEFIEIDQSGSTGNFTFDGYTDITLESVKAAAGSKEATLTFTGTPETEGTLTITVKPAAFKYQPQNAVTATVEISPPYGSLSAKPSGDLYAGTPADGTTITVDIVNSHGLHFDEVKLTKDSFILKGEATGLSITDVKFVNATQATLTLSGTPETAGKFQVEAVRNNAFHAAPASDVFSNDLTVNAAPDVTVNAVLDGADGLYAGTSAAGRTITLTITAGDTAFAAADKSNFSLNGDKDGLDIADAKLSDGKIVLTLSGTPTKKGTFSVQIDPKAFTIRPESAVTAAGNITINGANVKLTVTDNKLQAGVENGTVTLTLTGSKFADGLDASKITLTGGNDFKDLKLGGVKVDGSTVTLTVTGKPAVAGNITLTFAPDAFVPAPDEAVTVAVPVAKGAQTETTDSDTGSEEAAVFGTNVSDLAAAILSEEDKALFDKGANVEFELNVDNETQVDEGDKTQVESVSTAGGYTVGEYLDVTLSYTVNGGSPVDVSNTKTPIKVVFPIPASIQADGREYAVVRVHDGKAEIIAGPVTGTTITVSTDKFSTYAIIYRVAPAGSDSGTGTAGKTAPNTGDSADLALWTGMLALSLTGLAAVLAKRKKRSR